MTDIATFATVTVMIGLAAAWWVVRRRPRRPNAVRHDEPTTFSRPEDA